MYDIIRLAIDLDAFEYDYDYYGYMDAVDDRQQAVVDLILDLISGQNVDGIIEHLTEIVNEHDIEWEPRAHVLLLRIYKSQGIAF